MTEGTGSGPPRQDREVAMHIAIQFEMPGQAALVMVMGLVLSAGPRWGRPCRHHHPTRSPGPERRRDAPGLPRDGGRGQRLPVGDQRQPEHRELQLRQQLRLRVAPSVSPVRPTSTRQLDDAEHAEWIGSRVLRHREPQLHLRQQQQPHRRAGAHRRCRREIRGSSSTRAPSPISHRKTGFSPTSGGVTTSHRTPR